MAIDKSTIDADVFSAFYDLINDNITNPHGNSKWVFSSYPDKGFNTSSDYPIILVRDITPGDEENFTMTKNMVPVEVTIEAIATSKSSAYSYIDQVFNLIDTKRTNLRNNQGIKNLKMVMTDTDNFERNKIKLHSREKTFTFDLVYTKNTGY